MTDAPALAGRRCLITGAYGTLGTAIARRFHAEGARLLLVGRSEARLAALAGALAGDAGRVTCLALDLTSDAAANRIAAAVERWGGLEVLVNNAAIQGPIGPLSENDWAAWEATIRTDLLAPVRLCRALIGALARARRGKIINISGGGATSPRANFSAYAAAKTALVRFTEGLAEELRGRNIDVNALAPGALASAMTEAILAAGPAASGEREAAAAYRAKSGGGAPALEKAASLAAWLASSRSDGISGRLLAALWDPWATLDARASELAGTDIYTLRRIRPEDRGKEWDEG